MMVLMMDDGLLSIDAYRRVNWSCVDAETSRCVLRRGINGSKRQAKLS
jgi:hypothetical protein